MISTVKAKDSNTAYGKTSRPLLTCRGKLINDNSSKKPIEKISLTEEEHKIYGDRMAFGYSKLELLGK